MGRRAARITLDEIKRLIHAVRATGEEIGRIHFDGERLSIDTIKVARNEPPTLDTNESPDSVESIEDYKAWREKSRCKS